MQQKADNCYLYHTIGTDIYPIKSWKIDENRETIQKLTRNIDTLFDRNLNESLDRIFGRIISEERNVSSNTIVNGGLKGEDDRNGNLDVLQRTNRKRNNRQGYSIARNVVKSKSFKNWFGDWENSPESSSKIVNEDGTPMVVYHGDRKKGRYIFGSNTFFGETKQYASRYTNGTGDITSAYLNIKKPFDIRDKEAKRIFTEYRNGNEPAKTESGAMDWAEFDYDDLQEYLENNYPGKYDGIIMDEGADGGYGESVKARGLSYVPFYPNQIKSAEPVTYPVSEFSAFNH